MACSVIPLAMLLALCTTMPTHSSKIIDQVLEANVSMTTESPVKNNATDDGLFGDQPYAPPYVRQGNSSSGQVIHQQRYTIRTLTPGKQYILSAATPHDKPAHQGSKPQVYVGKKPDFFTEYLSSGGYPWCGYPYHCLQGSVCPTRHCPEGAFCCRSVMGICCHYSNTGDKDSEYERDSVTPGSHRKEVAEITPIEAGNYYPDPVPESYPKPNPVYEPYVLESLQPTGKNVYDLAERPETPQSVHGYPSVYDGLDDHETRHYPRRPVPPVTISTADRYTPPPYHYPPKVFSHVPSQPDVTHNKPEVERSSYASPTQGSSVSGGTRHIIHPVFGAMVIDVEDTPSISQPEEKEYSLPDNEITGPQVGTLDYRIPVKPHKQQNRRPDYEIRIPIQHYLPNYEIRVPLHPKPQHGMPDYQIRTPVPPDNKYEAPDYKIGVPIYPKPQRGVADYEGTAPLLPNLQYESKVPVHLKPQRGMPDYEIGAPMQPSLSQQGIPSYVNRTLVPPPYPQERMPGYRERAAIPDSHLIPSRPSVHSLLHSHAAAQSPSVQTVLHNYNAPAPVHPTSVQALLYRHSGQPIEPPYLQPHGGPSIRVVIQRPYEPSSVRELLEMTPLGSSYPFTPPTNAAYVHHMPPNQNHLVQRYPHSYPQPPNVYAVPPNQNLVQPYPHSYPQPPNVHPVPPSHIHLVQPYHHSYPQPPNVHPVPPSHNHSAQPYPRSDPQAPNVHPVPPYQNHLVQPYPHSNLQPPNVYPAPSSQIRLAQPYPHAYPQPLIPPPGGSGYEIPNQYSELKLHPAPQTYSPLPNLPIYSAQPYFQPFGSTNSYPQSYVPAQYQVLIDPYMNRAHPRVLHYSQRLPPTVSPVNPSYIGPFANTPMPIDHTHQFPHSHYHPRVPYSNIQHAFRPSKLTPGSDYRRRKWS